ncbi:MAG: zinc ribbon domain-containing protein [Clostridia bacterium]|nr:zinc ribbon domain-containing protein [Clostridia bacterium]
MEENKVIHKCYHCGTEYEGNFCPECGAKWLELTFCPECGADYNGTSRFCTHCGYSFYGDKPFMAPYAPDNEEIKQKVQAANKKANEASANEHAGRPNFAYTEKFISVAMDYSDRKINLKKALELTKMKRSAFYYHLRRLKQFGVIDKAE